LDLSSTLYDRRLYATLFFYNGGATALSGIIYSDDLAQTEKTFKIKTGNILAKQSIRNRSDFDSFFPKCNIGDCTSIPDENR
jgi:hypothetical protein